MARECKSGSINYRPSIETLRKIDAIVDAGLYKSRSDLVDAAVMRFLAWEEYVGLVNANLANVVANEAFTERFAQMLLPIVLEKIKDKLS